MSPTIKDGDELNCSLDMENLEIGDIVLFKDKESNEFVIHRLISINPLVTKGDRTYNKEFPEQLIARIHKYEPFKRIKAKASHLMLQRKPLSYLGLILLRVIP